jgi:hypothetical protein
MENAARMGMRAMESRAWDQRFFDPILVLGRKPPVTSKFSKAKTAAPEQSPKQYPIQSM